MSVFKAFEDSHLVKGRTPLSGFRSIQVPTLTPELGVWFRLVIYIF